MKSRAGQYDLELVCKNDDKEDEETLISDDTIAAFLEYNKISQVSKPCYRRTCSAYISP